MNKKIKKKLIKKKVIVWTPSAYLEYNPNTGVFKVHSVDEAYLGGERVIFPTKGSAYIEELEEVAPKQD